MFPAFFCGPETNLDWQWKYKLHRFKSVKRIHKVSTFIILDMRK